MVTFPQSGYFYDTASTPYPFLSRVGNNVSPRQYFVALNEGYVTGIDLQVGVSEVNSGDLPRDATFQVEVFEARSGGNVFVSVNCSDFWSIVSTGSITADQIVTAQSAQNVVRPFMNFGLNSAQISIESAGSIPGNYARGALKFATRFQGLGYSQGSSFFRMLQTFNDDAHYSTFLTAIDSGENYSAAIEEHNNLQFNLYGQIWANSRFSDIPSGDRLLSWGNSIDATPTRDFDPAGFRARAVQFTPKGSFITKAMAALKFEGANDLGLIGRIMTTDSTGNFPSTVVACAYYMLGQGGHSTAAPIQNLFTGDINNTLFPAWFIFSGGAAVDSGGLYWFDIHPESYSFSAAVNAVRWMTIDDNVNAGKRAFSRAGAISYASGDVVSSHSHQFETWHQVSVDVVSVSAISFNREFPTPGFREFPDYIIREFPKP